MRVPSGDSQRKRGGSVEARPRPFEAESGEELRKLGHVAEDVADVADRPGGGAVLLRHGAADLEVADQRLAGDQKLIGHDIPGADFEPPAGDGGGEPGSPLRMDFGDVVEHDGLPVEDEVAVLRLLFQQIQNPAREGEQPFAVDLPGLIPLPVPVGGAEIVESHRFNLLPLFLARSLPLSCSTAGKELSMDRTSFAAFSLLFSSCSTAGKELSMDRASTRMGPSSSSESKRGLLVTRCFLTGVPGVSEPKR